jgi:hypothetical protein
MERIRSRHFVNRALLDVHGVPAGLVADVWPSDGGGEPEMILVKLQRFSLRRWIPVKGSDRLGDIAIRVPWTVSQIDDAPDAEDHRWGDPPTVAHAYWASADHD